MNYHEHIDWIEPGPVSPPESLVRFWRPSISQMVGSSWSLRFPEFRIQVSPIWPRDTNLATRHQSGHARLDLATDARLDLATDARLDLALGLGPGPGPCTNPGPGPCTNPGPGPCTNPGTDTLAWTTLGTPVQPRSLLPVMAVPAVSSGRKGRGAQ